MKKLLALFLCVMLFVSVIPTSAFAINGPVPSQTEIAMQKAYEARNLLSVAYSCFGASNALLLPVSMLSAYNFSEKDNPNARAKVDELLNDSTEGYKQLLNPNIDLEMIFGVPFKIPQSAGAMTETGGFLNYEGLFGSQIMMGGLTFGGMIYAGYDQVGAGIGDDVTAKENEVIDNAKKAEAAEIEKLSNSVKAVILASFPKD